MTDEFSFMPWLFAILTILATITFYQLVARLQQKLDALWLQPMVISILSIIGILSWQNISFESYFENSRALNALLEPAVVALGFPLYQHLETIKKQWKSISLVLFIGTLIAIVSSFIITMLLVGDYTIAVALSLKSVTTPIAIVIAEKLNGNIAITAFAIILAGFFGAIVGPRWLTFIRVTSPKAQGLAIGTASHAIGTAIISKTSFEHAAFSSLALIVSAVLTAIISPFIISLLTTLL
jgi:predicted murein hydrolase (TIGR00659 family)